MEVVNSVISCANCGGILENPVLIECGELICKIHTQQEQVFCVRCDREHEIEPGKISEFPVKAIERLLQAKFEKLEFGDTYNSAVVSCDILSDLIKKYEYFINDPADSVHVVIDEMKDTIDSKKDELKRQIEDKSARLVNELEKYRNDCIDNLSLNEFQENLEQLDKIVEAARKILSVAGHDLNILKIDENGWKEITDKNHDIYRQIEVEFEKFKSNGLFLGRYEDHKKKLDEFNSYEVVSKEHSKERQSGDDTFLDIESPEDGRTWIHKRDEDIVTGKRNIWDQEKYHSMWTNKTRM